MEPLMTTEEAAMALGVEARTLENARSRGGITPPWIKVDGHKVRYDPDVVRRWREERSRVAPPPKPDKRRAKKAAAETLA
jgi:hypothetical protein